MTISRLTIGVLALVSAVLMAGCSGGGESARDERVHDLMADVLDPAADVIWGSAGYVITIEGETELWPTTEEGWLKVADAADVIIRGAATLQGSDYAPDQEHWVEIAQGMADAGARIKLAAETRDKEGLFDTGGHLYRVCLACHNRYVVEEDMDS